MKILVALFFRGEEKLMWNMDYILNLPLVVKIIILLLGLDILLIALWKSPDMNSNNESYDNKDDDEDKTLDIMSRS